MVTSFFSFSVLFSSAGGFRRTNDVEYFVSYCLRTPSNNRQRFDKGFGSQLSERRRQIDFNNRICRKTTKEMRAKTVLF